MKDPMKELPLTALLEKSQAAQKTQAENLQRVNDGLRDLVATLRRESDRLGTVSPARPTPPPLAAPASLPLAAAAPDPLREALRARDTQLARMQQLLDGIQAENQQLTERFQAVEQQGFQLLNGAVAASRLHGLLSRQEVLEALQDIVVNLVGTEQVALFEASEDGQALELARSLGVDAGPLRRVSAARGLLGQALRSGQVWVADDDTDIGALPHERTLSACVPLRVGPVPVGAVAIFRLLPHKERLDAVDRALFQQLGTHASTALYCARLHELQQQSRVR
ncbi:GAF domain-containing protein [Aggregicoccus sp. 17bor-14]|uniref:GAF domain-containing protein n=1 Tax=Myxococcaceae TaxID=31 RepID=UPI00129D1A9D|nr:MULTISPECIES: GAF domain-containing protein [Myxococcaceae]MBF5045110.1 GAF domain-containing protein [Simulacricoccus sp. 17bor-14]MRI90852.1 GAF domain-containing protein [Aggregicoccus sp. 17bor-14]